MSKSSDTVVHGDVDESILFDDGYSIVDDINTGTGTRADRTGEKSFTKENGKKCRNRSADEDINSVEVVSDTELKNEETIEKKEETKGVIEKENGKNGSKKHDAMNTENIVVKKEKLAGLKGSSTKNSDLSESTLIISNDDDLGTEVSTLDNSLAKTEKQMNELKKVKGGEIISTNVNRCDTSIAKTTRKKKPTEGSFVWVSNISKLVKASSLKKHFAECGKVNTAKVVTNGKVFFGYVEFESSEHALNCVKTLNNSILGGKNIIVSRNRPDVNKKTAPIKKNIVNNAIITLKSEEFKNQFVGTEQSEKSTASESKTSKDDKRKSEETTKDENRKRMKADDEKVVEIKKKYEADEKKQGDEKQKTDRKKPRSIKTDHVSLKNDEDSRIKLNDSRKKIEMLKQDLTRSQIEVSNLRRRLRNEQKKSKAEEISNQKYRLEVRSLSDQLKQTRSEFDKEMHRIVKKHKIELEKVEYYRDNFLKHRDELKRRQEELDREFRKLEQSKQSLEHMKRSRKSRSLSPPIKRFRGRDGAFHDHRSPPPPPKLTSEVRPKTPLERPPAYYEEKKPRAIYDRLGDYSEKSFPKESNGRERSSYTSDAVGIQKSSWSHSSAEPWKKTSNTTTFLKPYMERFGTSHQEFQAPPSYYSQSTLDYSKHNHFDIARKY